MPASGRFRSSKNITKKKQALRKFRREEKTEFFQPSNLSNLSNLHPLVFSALFRPEILVYHHGARRWVRFHFVVSRQFSKMKKNQLRHKSSVKT